MHNIGEDRDVNTVCQIEALWKAQHGGFGAGLSAKIRHPGSAEYERIEIFRWIG